MDACQLSSRKPVNESWVPALAILLRVEIRAVTRIQGKNASKVDLTLRQRYWTGEICGSSPGYLGWHSRKRRRRETFDLLLH